MNKPRVSQASQVLHDIPIQIDHFQPMAVIQFLQKARDEVRQIPTDFNDELVYPWNDDMKRGALLALAWVQTQVTIMAKHRFDVEGE